MRVSGGLSATSFRSPLVLFGIFDFESPGFIIILGAPEFFSCAWRLRAMLGAGVPWLHVYGSISLMGISDGAYFSRHLQQALTPTGLGLFIATLTLNFRLLLASIVMAGLGVAGILLFREYRCYPLLKRGTEEPEGHLISKRGLGSFARKKL